MPRDSQGNTNPLPGTIVQTGDTILPSQHNPALVDLYAMMSQSLSRDGQGGMRANLAMNNFQVTGLGSATQPGNAVPLSQFQAGTPVGSVVDYAGVNPPNTWMFAFGQTIEVNAYPEFVAACYVGNSLNHLAGYGYRTTSQTDPSSNRSTSGQYIVLPDFRDRVSIGRGNMGGPPANRISQSIINTYVVGGAGGADLISLSVDNMPSHNHGGVTSTAGLHQHNGAGFPTGSAGGGLGVVQSVGNLPGATANIQTFAAGDHSHSIQSQGGGAAHINVQPSLVANKIIKVSY